MPVFDQGYQHWNGTLTGHAWRWLTIARQGVRVALQNSFLRFFTLMAMFPALALVGVLILWGFLEQNADFAKPLLRNFNFPQAMIDNPEQFRGAAWTLAYYWFFLIQLFATMILVLMVGPSLISQDLRFNAIPLYFSRPLYRWDYFLGKLGVIAFFLMATTVVPALLGYVLGVLLSFKFQVILDTWHLVPGSIAYGLVIVVSAGTLMLALSSLSSSSRYVAAFWIALWLITAMVASVLTTIHDHSERGKHPHPVGPRLQPPPLGQPVPPLGMQELPPPPPTPAEMRAAMRAHPYLGAWQPMLSYTAQLDCVGRALLGVDDTAVQVATQALPQNWSIKARLDTLKYLTGPQFGWYWSALILLALFGASLWLLTTRVRTLDRLS